MGSIHLIRHGQASWGADDYDQLSDRGYEQSKLLGISWEAADWSPTAAVAGSMQRHAQTAIAAIDACGQGDGYDVDAGWNEYDHLGLTNMTDASQRPSDERVFQAMLDRALEDWVSDRSESPELFTDFYKRVVGALDAAIERAGSGQSVAVFTSGGPIGLVASHLLVGDASLFIAMNRVVMNSSVTTLIVGRGGTRLLAFNETGHLPRDLQTFR